MDEPYRSASSAVTDSGAMAVGHFYLLFLYILIISERVKFNRSLEDHKGAVNCSGGVSSEERVNGYCY